MGERNPTLFYTIDYPSRMHRTSRDERALIEKSKTDPETFSELYNLYFPKIFRYVSWRVGSRPDAEDLVSEIFTKTLTNLDSFKWQKNVSFSSWIFRIAHNALIDYYRSETKRKRVNLEDLPEIEDDAILADEELTRKQQFKVLFQMIGELPDRQAEIITMRFFTGMKNKEIADVLGIKEKSVASSLCRGLEVLHRKFNKQ